MKRRRDMALQYRYLQQLAEDNEIADLIKNEWDEPTIGLLLCRDGNRMVVEYALSVTDKPLQPLLIDVVSTPDVVGGRRDEVISRKNEICKKDTCLHHWNPP